MSAPHSVTPTPPQPPPRGLLPMSLRVRMPLIGGSVVLIVGIVLTVAAYVAFEQTTKNLAQERLSRADQQLIALIGNGNMTAQARTLAHRPAMMDYMRNPAVPPSRQVIALLDSATRGTTAAVEVRDLEGHVLLARGAWVEKLTAANPFPRPTGHDSLALGDFEMVGDSLGYPTVARITGDEPQGYVVVWRRVVSAPRARQALLGIVGPDVKFLLGNADGTLWTDLSGPSPAPPKSAYASTQTLVRTTAPGSRDPLFTLADQIAGTPWLLVFELPESAALAPAHAFLWRMAIVAIVCVTLGLIATWLLARQITRPLQEVTDAVDAIAAGERERRVDVRRGDELGRLATSFDIMVERLDDSQRRLEEKVAERTRELDATVQQLRNAQETLIRREKLASLGQLASGIGHELRNPLGVMSNAIYYLELVLESPPDKVAQYLKILRQQVNISAKIVGNLLDMSRTTPAQRQSVAVQALAEEQLRQVPLHDGIRVEADFPAALPQAHVDPVHAGQVVLNLITNAVQALGDTGGTITLRGRTNGVDRVMLEVSDSGPGIPSEHADKIFEPLFTTKARGIGLGLAVSRSLAQTNGGDLTLAANHGPGATFEFIMLAAPEAR